jgi:hypothetical protein
VFEKSIFQAGSEDDNIGFVIGSTVTPTIGEVGIPPLVVASDSYGIMKTQIMKHEAKKFFPFYPPFYIDNEPSAKMLNNIE